MNRDLLVLSLCCLTAFAYGCGGDTTGATGGGGAGQGGDSASTTTTMHGSSTSMMQGSTTSTMHGSSTSTTTTGPSTTGPSTTGSGGGTCYQPTGCGAAEVCTVVDVEEIASAAPSAMAGTIADGTYDLTAFNVYTGPGGPSGPAGFQFGLSLVLNGGMFASTAVAGPSGHVSPQSEGGTFTVDTSTAALTLSASCGNSMGAPGAATYSVTAAGLTFYVPGMGGTTDEYVLVKQP